MRKSVSQLPGDIDVVRVADSDSASSIRQGRTVQRVPCSFKACAYWGKIRIFIAAPAHADGIHLTASRKLGHTFSTRRQEADRMILFFQVHQLVQHDVIAHSGRHLNQHDKSCGN